MVCQAQNLCWLSPNNHSDEKGLSVGFFVDFYIVSGDNSVSKQAFRVISIYLRSFYYASTQEKAE